MSSIQSYVNKLRDFNIELKRLNKNSCDIRKQIKVVEKNILQYLNEKDQPGVKYKDIAIVIENKTKRTGKSKQKKEEDSLRILEGYGISDCKNVLKQIQDAQRGDEVENKYIKIKQIK